MAHSLLGDPLQVPQESRGTMSLAKWELGQVGGSGVEEPRVTDCSLLPAAGTVSVGTSSCLSLSQHPSPTSVFRHHYIPYFRGKACGAQRGRSSHVSAWLPEPCVSCLCSSCVVCVWLYFVGVSMFLEGEQGALSLKVQLEGACQ